MESVKSELWNLTDLELLELRDGAADLLRDVCIERVKRMGGDCPPTCRVAPSDQPIRRVIHD